MQTGDTGARFGSADFFFEQLTAYVRSNASPDFDPGNDRLLDVLDSVGLLQLIMFIEQEFQIVLDPASLSIEVFIDLRSLAAALQNYATAA